MRAPRKSLRGPDHGPRPLDVCDLDCRTARKPERSDRGREGERRKITVQQDVDEEEEDEKNCSPTFFSIRRSIPPQLPSPHCPLQAITMALYQTAAVCLISLLFCSTSSAQVREIFSGFYFSSSQFVALQSTHIGRAASSPPFSEVRASAAAGRSLVASCDPRLRR